MSIFRFIFVLVDAATIAALGVLLCIGAEYVILILSAFLLPSRQRAILAELPPVSELPDILVQLPVYNEETCVERVLRVAAGLNWPKDRLHIQLIDSSTDRTTEIASRVIDELRAAGAWITHLRRRKEDGFKAGAHAAGFECQDAQFVAVLDADFRVPPDWLENGMRIMLANPDLGFVQSRLEFSNGNENSLTRVQQMIQDIHFIIEQEGRDRQAEFCGFDGTGAIWRATAIADAGGWSSATLLEGWDLSLRAWLRGWRGAPVMEPVTMAEAIETLASLRAQSRRWVQGGTQVVLKRFGELMGSKALLRLKAYVAMVFLENALFPCLALALIAALLHEVLGTPMPPLLGSLFVASIIVAVLIIVGTTLVPFMLLRRGSIGDYLRTMGLLPILYAYLAFTNSAAVFDSLLGRSTDYVRTPKTGA